MKKVLYGLLLSLIGSLYGNQHGFIGETRIQLANGNKIAIEQLKENDSVACQGTERQEAKIGKITNFQRQLLSHYFILDCQYNNKHETIILAPEQQLFDVVQQTFLSAEQIYQLINAHKAVIIASHIGNFNDTKKLSNYRFAFIVNGVEINDPAKALPFYTITVNDCHTFQISESGYVAHNFGFLIAFAFGAGQVALETIGLSLFGAAATYSASKILEQQRQHSIENRYWEHGQIYYYNPNPPAPPTPPTPPNNPGNGGPGKPPTGGNSNNGNQEPEKPKGLSTEERAAAAAATAEATRRKNEEIRRASEAINSPTSNIKKQTVDELIKSKESTIEIRDEHILKREQYAADPHAFDNKGLLKNNPEHAPKIIEGRLKNLDSQINGQQKRIDQYDNEIQSRLQNGETPRKTP
jgi:hypothetical protein